MTSPLITVVVCTYNRADRVEQTLQAVLAQEGCPFDVVVVDDGSTDATPKVLAAIEDDRLRVVRQTNAGLSAARNAGLAVATGAWIVFLDDDDVPHPGWLATLAGPMDDPSVAITCCGARGVDPDGNVIFPLPPIALGEPFGDDLVASYRAGTFAVRTELCRRAGGYLDGLGTSHQFELFIRLLAEARRAGQRVASDEALVLDIERRPVDDRRSSNPHIAYDATLWILTRHPQAFAGQDLAVAAFEGVAGTSAARAGRWGAARHHFWQAARLVPRKPRNWGRIALACLPPLGRRVWNRHGPVPTDPDKAGVRLQPPSGSSGRAPELFLAWGYQQNEPIVPVADDAEPSRWARRLAARLDRKLPGLVQCLDTLECHDDPIGLLQGFAREAAGLPLLVSTPDRARSDPGRPLGPPSDPDHRREWTHDQLWLLLRSTGYQIERTWRRGSQMAVLARLSSDAFVIGG